MTAYREAAEAPCHICGDLTDRLCDLCQKSTCGHHFFAGVQDAPTCRECVRDYQGYMTAPGSILPAMITWFIGFSVAAAIIPFSLWGLLALPSPILADHLRKRIRTRMRRARFFDIMRRRGALPEPEPIHPDHVESAKMIRKLEKELRRKSS